MIYNRENKPDDFLAISAVAYFSSMLEDKHLDSDHVKKLSYELFENFKKDGRLNVL